MNQSAFRFWHRSSPVVGMVGGLFVAAWIHLFGSTPGTALLFELLPVGELFAVSPVVGYVTFVALGGVTGWAARRLEDAYLFTG